MTSTSPAERKFEAMLEVAAYFSSLFAAVRLAVSMQAALKLPLDAIVFVTSASWFAIGCTAFLLAFGIAKLGMSPLLNEESRSISAVLNAAGRQGPHFRSRLVNLLLRTGCRICLLSLILPSYVAAFFLAAWLAKAALDPAYATWSWFFLTLALAIALILLFSMILVFLSTIATRRSGVDHLIEDLGSSDLMKIGRWSVVGRLMRIAWKPGEEASPLR